MSLVVVAGIAAALLVVYDVIAIVFLVKDYDVVHSCHASNTKVHAIWATNLWHYVLMSVIFPTLWAALLVFIPLKRSIDATRKHFTRNRLHASKDEALKYGLLSNLPDWLFLWVGTTLVCASMVVLILAFWGYFELFMARPWCNDKKTAFEQLDLWHFARVTFFLQIISGIVMFTWGLAYWAAPFILEMTTASAPKKGNDPLNGTKLPRSGP